jgi:hypothetical protein
MNVVTRFTISRSFVSFLLSGRAEVVVCVFLEMAAAESRDITPPPPKTSRFY